MTSAEDCGERQAMKHERRSLPCDRSQRPIQRVMLRTMRATRTLLCRIGLCLALGAGATSGCGRKMYDPSWATRPYPDALHSTNVADMQVFRRDTKIEIINATARSYGDVDVWINQRYVNRVPEIPAGQAITLSLWEFHDEY